MSLFNRAPGAAAKPEKVSATEAIGHWQRVMGSDDEVVKALVDGVASFEKDYDGPPELKRILMSGGPVHDKFMQVLQLWTDRYGERAMNNQSIPESARRLLSRAELDAHHIIQADGTGEYSREDDPPSIKRDEGHMKINDQNHACNRKTCKP